jgi:hypothetical protein
LISNFYRVLYVVRFLLGNSPASEFYMPIFQNTLSSMKMEQCVLKCQHIKFRRWGITEKKTYNKISLHSNTHDGTLHAAETRKTIGLCPTQVMHAGSAQLQVVGETVS